MDMLLSTFLRYNFWVKDFFRGSTIRKQYKDLHDILKKKNHYNKRCKLYLSDILRHAVDNTDFYKNNNPANLENFPIVNKNILLENYKSVKVDMSHIPWQKGNIHIQKTSGSTGTPFAIPQDTRKRNRRLAELKYFGNIIGYKSHEKLIHLRIWTNWQSKTKGQSFWENIIPFDSSNLSDKRMKDLCDLIIKEKAVSLRAYSSSLDLLCDYVRRNDINIKTLKVVVATSEALQEATRENVKKYLNCDIVSLYGNEENGVLGQENPLMDDRKFYLNNAGYHFEFLKMDNDEIAAPGELARIVLTDYFNYAFPMIRYDTGDTCVYERGVDGLPVITKLYGRRFDMIFDTKGNPIFPMVLSRTLKNYIDIMQWQFIQEDRTQYTLKLRIRDNCKFTDEM